MKTTDENPAGGIFFLFPAYLIWGLSPIFWKLLSHVNSFELLLHRTVWSLLFLTVILCLQKRGQEILLIFKHPEHLGILFITSCVLAFNWYLFIWAVNHDNILQTSLAYYINPLLIIFLGMIFFKEKLRRLQVAALIIAGMGVAFYTLFLGQFPWISIAIAVSFATYAMIHKIISVQSLPGLCFETFLLSIPSLGYLYYLHLNADSAFMNISFSTDLLLSATCLVTGLPLLLFTIGAKRCLFITVGFMQYIAPCCSFLLAVFYFKESFPVQKLITFIMIWTALVLYAIDSVYQYRKNQNKQFNV